MGQLVWVADGSNGWQGMCLEGFRASDFNI